MHYILSLASRNESLYYFGLANMALGLLFFILSLTTSKQVKGVNAFNKPFKFAISIGLYCWSMAWICYYLPHFNLHLFNATTIGLLGFEIVYIALQAARGQLSHFNTTSTLYMALFQLMGLAATVVTIYTAYVGVLFLKADLPDLSPGYLWSIRLGLWLFVIFSFEGAFMGAKMAHTVGGPDGSPGIAVFKWSKHFGDLRVAHFIGMHALQLIPIVATVLHLNAPAVIAVGVLYALLALWTLVQALRAQPLVRG